MSFDIHAELYNLRETLTCGQMFRAYEWSLGHFDVLSLNHYAEVKQEGERIYVDCDSDDNSYWRRFFNFDQSLSLLAEKCSTNPFLAEVFEFSKGLVILRQDPWECLASFIISQQKRIPQIQACVEKLCDLNGRTITSRYCAFPTPIEISSLQLNTVGLGYRMPYIYNAAAMCSVGGLNLDAYNSDCASYMEAISVLNSLQGVGPKVADCVALYGLGHGSAFPVDTHIAKILALPEMQGFDYREYGDLAGLLQLYLFNYALANGL